MKVVMAMSGASGMDYAVRLGKWLIENGHALDLLLSTPARKVFELEIEPAPKSENAWRKFFGDHKGLLKFHEAGDFDSPLASGSAQRDAMVIIPCSMGMVGRIASGLSSNLIERCADVTLKEQRPLAIVFREAPLNLIHLENLTRLARAGAIIIPEAPGFYNRPKDLESLVEGLVGRVLKEIGIENNLEKEWGTQ
jgi:flavin prenyltransferase